MTEATPTIGNGRQPRPAPPSAGNTADVGPVVTRTPPLRSGRRYLDPVQEVMEGNPNLSPPLHFEL